MYFVYYVPLESSGDKIPKSPIYVAISCKLVGEICLETLYVFGVVSG